MASRRPQSPADFEGKWAKLVGAKERVEEIAADLVEHYETRTGVLEGKAMIVAVKELKKLPGSARKKKKP